MWVGSIFHSLLSPFKPLERTLLAVLPAEMPPAAKAILERQIRATNRVQRHAESKEVCLYRMRWGKPSFVAEDAFRLNTDHETKLATISLSDLSSGQRLRADFWLVSGFLFSITFNVTPKALLGCSTVQIQKTVLHCDPMSPPEKRTPSPVQNVVLDGWLNEWAKTYAVTQTHAPLPRPHIERRLSEIGSKLPDEYLDIINRTEGLAVGTCRVLGIDEVRALTMERGNYWMLAEVHDKGALVVEQENDRGEVYLFDYEGSRPVALGKSFRKAVEKNLAP